MKPATLNSGKPEKTHYMTTFRINYLNRVLDKLQELLDSHYAMCESTTWYAEHFLDEDCEETLGLVFVACQIFIAGSVGDITGNKDVTQKDKERVLKNAPQFKGFRTKIELINAVANYYKHKDEGAATGETFKILEGYSLLNKEFPILEAFALVSEDDKLTTLSSFLIGWRNNLFNTLLATKTRSIKMERYIQFINVVLKPYYNNESIH